MTRDGLGTRTGPVYLPPSRQHPPQVLSAAGDASVDSHGTMLGMRRKVLEHRYHRLSVLNIHQAGRKVDVICDCGTKKSVWRNHLMNNQVKSCGCYADETRAGRNWDAARPQKHTYRLGDPQIGDIYGRLTVTGEPQPGHDRTVECQCSCGNTKVVAIKDLKNRYVLSCGCYRRDGASQLQKN